MNSTVFEELTMAFIKFAKERDLVLRIKSLDDNCVRFYFGNEKATWVYSTDYSIDELNDTLMNSHDLAELMVERVRKYLISKGVIVF